VLKKSVGGRRWEAAGGRLREHSCIAICWYALPMFLRVHRKPKPDGPGRKLKASQIRDDHWIRRSTGYKAWDHAWPPRNPSDGFDKKKALAPAHTTRAGNGANPHNKP